MDIVFSSWNLSKSIDHSEIGMANISNFLAQKHGHKTILYCGENEIDLFKHIPYDEKRILPNNIMLALPNDLWSMSKIVALSLLERPSLVVDFDLFFFKKLNNSRLNSDIVYYHDENYTKVPIKRLDLWMADLKPKKIKHINSDISRNCAMIGGQDYKIIKEIANELITHIIETKDKWEYFSSEEVTKDFLKIFNVNSENSFYIPVLLIEQVWMFDFFKNSSKTYTPYFENASLQNFIGLTEGPFHLWEKKVKHVKSICREFSKRVVDYNKPYEDYEYSFPFLTQVNKDLDKSLEEMKLD